MATTETPSAVMYAVLKQLKVNNKEAASILLSDQGSIGGGAPRDRINERTYLHRVVHSAPGEYHAGFFANLEEAAHILCARIIAASQGKLSSASLAELLGKGPALLMAQALQDNQGDAALFTNVVEKIQALPSISDADRASLAMLAFIGVGCLGSAAAASSLVEQFLHSIAQTHGFMTTPATEADEVVRFERPAAGLGLVRVVDGALDLQSVHGLYGQEGGTVIGSMATDEHSLNNVGPLVSRRHLRIFQDEEGRWFAQGLGSTNGTTLIKGATKEPVVIEPPRAERKGANDAPPVQIQPGDALCLADTTVFLVMQVR